MVLENQLELFTPDQYPELGNEAMTYEGTGLRGVTKRLLAIGTAVLALGACDSAVEEVPIPGTDYTAFVSERPNSDWGSGEAVRLVDDYSGRQISLFYTDDGDLVNATGNGNGDRALENFETFLHGSPMEHSIVTGSDEWPDLSDVVSQALRLRNIGTFEELHSLVPAVSYAER